MTDADGVWDFRHLPKADVLGFGVHKSRANIAMKLQCF